MTEKQDENRQGVEGLFDELESLVRSQIELARGNNLAGVEALAARVGSVAAEIAKAGLLRPEFAERRRRLKDLNGKLCLMIATERARVGEQLRQIRVGRRVLSKYRQVVS